MMGRSGLAYPSKRGQCLASVHLHFVIVMKDAVASVGDSGSRHTVALDKTLTRYHPSGTLLDL